MELEKTTMESGCHLPPSRRQTMNEHRARNGYAVKNGSAMKNGLAMKNGSAAKNGHAVKNGFAVKNGLGTNGNGANGHRLNGHGSRPGDVARELISALWERSVPLITDRLNGLDIACEAANLGRLSPIMRRGAMDTAHKLAGSLGMFGYPRGTELAREIEQMLEDEGVVDSGLLRELVVELRGCLPL